MRQAQFLQLLLKRLSDGHDQGNLRAIGRVKVEEEVIGVIEICNAVGPRVVVDATKPGQKEKGSAVIGRRVVNHLTAMFGIQRNRLEPIRYSLAQVFLKKSLALYSVGIASQNQSPVAQKRQDEIRHAVVVGQEIPFRNA